MEGPYKEARDDWDDVVRAEMARHLPMVAPIFQLVWEHVTESYGAEIGRCCVDDAEEGSAS